MRIQTHSKQIYIRDTQGNVMAVYQARNDSLFLDELHLYGSSRLGVIKANEWLPKKDDNITNVPPVTLKASPYTLKMYNFGKKRYELADWLGNVRVVINDKKTPMGTNPTNMTYAAQTISVSDYYPFGMVSRSYSDGGGYRFGFNGKEQDNEIIGEGRWQDYGARMYRPDLARFFSPDPLIVYQKKYPELSSYQFASNTPLQAIDLDGKEAFYIKDIILNKNSGTARIILMTDPDVPNNMNIDLQTRLPNGDIIKGSLGIYGLDKKFPGIRYKDYKKENLSGRHIVYDYPPKILSSHPAKGNEKAMDQLQMNDFLFRIDIPQSELFIQKSIDIVTSRAQDNGKYSVVIPENAQNVSATFQFDQLNAEPNTFTVKVLDPEGNVLQTFNPSSGEKIDISDIPAGGSIEFNTTYNPESSSDDYVISGSINYQEQVEPTIIEE